jgi:hypothetical protein
VIAKVLRGAGFGGLLAYLYGPGREEEHVDARIVAGCTAAQEPRGMGRELRAYAAQNERASRPVLHASLRVPPEEAGRLDDQGWGRVAQEWMAEMGYRLQKPVLGTLIRRDQTVSALDCAARRVGSPAFKARRDRPPVIADPTVNAAQQAAVQAAVGAVVRS